MNDDRTDLESFDGFSLWLRAPRYLTRDVKRSSLRCAQCAVFPAIRPLAASVRCTACPARISTLLRLVPPDRTSRDTFAQNASQQIPLTNSVAIVDAQCPELDIPALNGLPNQLAICA